jgi:hypothetical protein
MVLTSINLGGVAKSPLQKPRMAVWMFAESTQRRLFYKDPKKPHMCMFCKAIQRGVEEPKEYDH